MAVGLESMGVARGGGKGIRRGGVDAVMPKIARQMLAHVVACFVVGFVIPLARRLRVMRDWYPARLCVVVE